MDVRILVDLSIADSFTDQELVDTVNYRLLASDMDVNSVTIIKGVAYVKNN